MQKIPTEEFYAPRWQKIMYSTASAIVFVLGINVLMIKEPNWVIFLAPFIFIISFSMLLYTRLKLIISDDKIRLTGGLKRYHFLWSDIKKIDMVRLGKYKTPLVTIYYSGGKVTLSKSLYLTEFNRILLLLEMKVNPELFTENYQKIRHQMD